MSAPTLSTTLALARDLFAGVVDTGGRPYFDHCARVLVLCLFDATDDEVHAALLHDVLEDTPTTAADLRAMGYSERTVSLVEALTRNPETETYRAYIERIATSGDAGLIRIKLADNADNRDPARLAVLAPEERARLATRYAKARRVLLAGLGS